MSPANQMRIRYEPFYGHVTFLWSLAAACKLCLCAILPLLQMLRNSKHATAHIGTFIVMNRPCLHHVSACGTVNIAPAVWTIYDVLHFIAVSQYFGRESPAEKKPWSADISLTYWPWPSAEQWAARTRKQQIEIYIHRLRQTVTAPQTALCHTNNKQRAFQPSIISVRWPLTLLENISCMHTWHKRLVSK